MDRLDASPRASGFTVRGTIMQTPDRNRLEVRHRALITVGPEGTIESVQDGPDTVGTRADVELPDTAVVLPGLVDTHVHAPQWPQLGTGLDLPFERWLFEYTFPLEARFVDHGWAATVWDSLVAGLLAHGTTTAVYYGTVDTTATTLLAATCVELGQRAFVGRVGMDHPDETPEWYRDGSAAAGVAESARSIEQIRALGSDLVRPIVTPRFIPACSDALLEGLAELATSEGVFVQTHCSENDWEHRHVLDRCGTTDAAALDRFGLLGAHTVLAHGGHLDDADLARIRHRGAGVAHCPLSNVYFGDVVFPARRALDQGTIVGLGSDVAGGAQPGLLAQCGHAVDSARLLQTGVDAGLASDQRGVAGSAIDTVTAFWMATVGGSTLLGQPTGLLVAGRSFDAFVVDTARDGAALRIWPELDDDARTFEKIVRLAGAADIDRVWVRGRRVR